ncbi:MAG: hypothetical protein H0Z25_02415 [Kosmotoga sp.]|nr:hypothetical protein [Kosmotoga sp.]
MSNTLDVRSVEIMTPNSNEQAPKSRFILDEPTTEDKFVHDKIAEKIAEFIANENNGTSIALKGKWGSGKSSVIEILKQKLKQKGKEKYKVFIFDVWAELGHDFRQVFLLRFLDWINNEKVKIGKKEKIENFEDKRNQILGKHRTIERQVTPKDRGALLFLFILVTALVLIPSIIGGFTNLLVNRMPRNTIFSLLAFYTIPLTIAELFYYSTLKELITKQNSKEKNTKEQGKEEDKKISLIKILHCWFILECIAWVVIAILWLVNIISNIPWSSILIISVVYIAIPILMLLISRKRIDSVWSVVSLYSGLLIGKYTDDETTSSITSNSLDFEKEFCDLLKEKFNDNENLIIVIDNVDRTPGEKVDEIFSALKPFMVSDKISRSFKNVWYIVPFDPNGIKIGKDKGGYDYFNKLFKKEFYVPEPVYGGWQSYLEEILKKLEINESIHLLGTAIQIANGFKLYYENLEHKKNEENHESQKEKEKEEETDTYKIENKLLPPTPREIKKFINNYITVRPSTLRPSETDDTVIFSYSLFAAFKTYGMLNSSEELKEIFIEKDADNITLFEHFLSEKGYSAYSFIPDNLKYRIFAIYHNTDYQKAYFELNTDELELILSQPTYTKRFKEIISNIPESSRDVISSINSVFNNVIDWVYKKQPHIIIASGIYLKELKETLPDAFEEIKEDIFNILKENLNNKEDEEIEKFISSNVDKLFEVEAEDQIFNMLKSTIFLSKESGLDLLNPILEYSNHRGNILVELINNYENLDLNVEDLEENFHNPESDTEHISIVLEFIGEKFSRKEVKEKNEIIDIIMKTMDINKIMIEKALVSFAQSNIDEKLLFFLKGLGIVYEFEKYSDEKDDIQKLLLSKFINPSNNWGRNWEPFVKYLLTLYSYYDSEEIRAQVLNALTTINNAWNDINNTNQNETKKNIASAIFDILLIDEKAPNNLKNIYNQAIALADEQAILDFMEAYELDNFYKSRKIPEICEKLANKITSNHRNKIEPFYNIIYENLLNNEEHESEWIFNLYSFLKNIGIDKESIFKAVEKLLENKKYPSDGTKVNTGNIELWDHILGIKNDEEMAEKFNKRLNPTGEDIETLFADPNFYSCCAKHKVVLDSNLNLHKIILKAISDNLVNFVGKNSSNISNFFKNQNEAFLKDIILDFVVYMNNKAHDIENIQKSEEEIDLMLELFNPIFENIVQKYPHLLDKLKNKDLTDSLNNINTNEISENIKAFFELIGVNPEE